MTTLPKIDLYQLHKDDYVAPRKPVLLQTQPAVYLGISGQGAPGGPAFTACIGALYGVAFTVKMTRKFGGRQDYTINKLEGQWFFGENHELANLPREQWRWRLMIRTPEFVSREEIDQAVEKLLQKGKEREVQEVKLESISEGLCVQMLHVGPYDREGDTVQLMRTFAEKNGLQLHGPHHEIYLSDPRRVAPERLKTILREPVIKRG